MNPLALIPLLAAAVLATEFRFLPKVIDVTIITNAAGLGALLCTVIGALLGFGPDRLGRLALLGTVAGGLIGTLVFSIGLLNDVL